MISSPFTFTDSRDKEIFVRKWMPASGTVKGFVQIIHGVAEHSERYERFAEFMTGNGYGVYVHDHQGHGKTDPENPGFIDVPEDGFGVMMNNICDVYTIIRKNYPGYPVFQLGHSMGAALVMRIVQQRLCNPDGVIYSGIPAPPPPEARIAVSLAASMSCLYGPDAPGNILEKLTFGPYEKRFKPMRTRADWLSRDPEEVDIYICDPECFFTLSASFYRDFLKGVITTLRTSSLTQHPAYMPVLFISGDADPVGNDGKGVRYISRTLEKNGVADVTLNLYPDGRHEMLNEINRQQVMNDIVMWINDKMAEKSRKLVN